MANKHRWQRYVPLLAGTVIVLVVGVLLILFVRNLMSQKPEGPTRQVAQTVKIVRPPPPEEPPPPPPPPPEEKLEEPLEQQEPEQAPNEAAPAEQLGLDAEGAAGGDGFGLAARKGGRDLVGSGTGAFVWYTNLLKDSIQQTLSEDERVRKGSYQVLVRVWLDSEGRVERITLAGTSGNRDLDGAIETALARLGRVREAPPLEMPQPITLRIVSRS